MIDQLRGRLVVSCQPVKGGAMDRPEIVAAMAKAALDGGAAGLRIEGIANLHAVRALTNAPIIGLVKRDLADSPVRITPFAQDVADLAAAGADIIAIDATHRDRPESVAALIEAVHAAKRLAMADCATPEDGQAAAAAGAALLGSTMSGYTGNESPPERPDLDLVAVLAATGLPAIAEGRYHRPEQAAQAIGAGAHAVVVGSAITRIEHVTGWFADAVSRAGMRA
ncbi:putative N-acetylmannosamine-6-phosphate 2-epimerase [Limimaricola soesokkakensis]|uniref:putative N-acetylmannosamine-6-phosphate 2-epimerase n=1 Tax=Limimaricola soesokkakensis TaxID=1343159 RepID=UPI0035113A0D